MFKFLKKNRFRLSIVAILFYFLFTLIAQVEKPRSETWFSTLTQSIAYPFQSAYYFASTHLTEAWNHYIWLVGVREKNRELLEKLHEYEAEIERTKEIRIAHRRLLESLRFKRANEDRKTFAQVVGEVENGFSRIIMIDKGSDDGIKRNFSVVSHNGIVGKIQSVTPLQSVVQLITDSHSRFPVLIQRTRTKAFLQGANGSLKLEHVPRRVRLKNGDAIIASGLAGIFPKGFPVGTVEKIDRKEFGLFQSASVAPNVDIGKLEEVAVILEAVGDIHRPLFTETN